MPVPEKIIFICPRISNRLQYTLGFLSGELGVRVEFLPESEFKPENINRSQVVMHYSPAAIDGTFNVYSSGLLFETHISKQATGVFKNQSQTFLFPAPGGFELPFDIFSAIFFLLSRYEEYLPFKPDRFGRFEADQSLAYLHGFLEEPVVDQWVGILRRLLKLKYPGLEFPERKFRYISTFDIDNPWAFLHKGFRRVSGGILKALLNGKINDFLFRIKVLTGKAPDPYDTYPYIKCMEDQYDFKSVFFFLSGNYGGFDVNYALRTGHFRNLIHDSGPDRSIGIHPSFRSFFDAALLRSEYEYFSGILGHKPGCSRQHFLLMNFPETYRRLLSIGIQEDYSMGYASSAGFRAGTCSSFHFYDLEKEIETTLVIFPFAIMDVTFLQYMSLSADEAIERIMLLADKVKKADGTFTSLWHNESLSEYGVWKGWRKVYERMVEEVGRRDEGLGTRDEGLGTRDER